MSLFDKLNKCVEVMSGVITVDTGLKTISGDAKIVFRVDTSKLLEVTTRLRKALTVDFPLDRLRHIQLLDEYESATIEGACTTVDRVLSGSTDKSDIMVRQSMAGLQYLLSNDLNEKSMIEAWRVITSGCCDNTTAGTTGYRTGMVYIGSASTIVHVPAAPEQVPILMRSLFEYENEYVLLNAIVYGFYIAYVHPFPDGNGRLSRVVMQKILGVPGLPLSKSIRIRLSDYYKALRLSEYEVNQRMDITAFSDFIIESVLAACDMIELYGKPLSTLQSKLLSSIDKAGRGCFGISKVAVILGCDSYTAGLVVSQLEEMGYVEHDVLTNDYRVIWR